MPKNRITNQPMASINVVPYIDVMLVLLIIFMVAAPLMTQGVQVDLPTVTSNELDIKSTEPIVITINKSGQTFLNINSDPKQVIASKEMLTNIKARLEKTKTTAVLIKADQNALHGTVIKVMASLQNAGINNIGIVTQSTLNK